MRSTSKQRKHKIKSIHALYICAALILASATVTLADTPFRLVGASVSGNGIKLAIIENSLTGEQVVAEPQAQVFGSAKVLEIQNGSIVLEYKRQRMLLKQQATTRNRLSLANDVKTSNEIIHQLASGIAIEDLKIAGAPVSKIDVSSLELTPISKEDEAILFSENR